jgi:glycosyltransferase involved in cell wall biosynthesis
VASSLAAWPPNGRPDAELRVAYAFPILETEGNGRAVHVTQFLRWSRKLGHDVLTLGHHPDASDSLSATPWRRWLQLRGCDCVYVRLEQTYLSARWARSPYRRLIGNPPVIWEFNTVPSLIEAVGGSRAEVKAAEDTLRRLGRDVLLGICGTDEAAEYATEVLGLRRVVTVPNGSDPVVFSPSTPPDERMERFRDKVNVVWMGSAGLPWHDLPMLLQAAEMVARDPDGSVVIFHLLGHGADPGATTTDNVVTHGYQPYASLPGWLAAMDIGLALYRDGPAQYGSPLKLFDYLASGLAVVATQHPQMAQVLEIARQGDQIVPRGNAVELARIVLRLAKDPGALASRKRQSRAALVERYTWERTVRRSYQAIEEAIRDQLR